MERLKGQQCLALYLPDNANYRIMGVAGGGKTLIATYKLLLTYLQNPDKKIIFLTVNKQVNEQVKDNLKELCNSLIENNSIDALHTQLLSLLKDKRGEIVKTVYTYFRDLIRESTGNNKITGKKFKITDYENLINQFKKQFQIKLPNRSVQFFRDEILWLLDMNITKEEYLTDNRIGRAGTRLEKGPDREAIYQLFEFYQKNIIDSKHYFSMDSIYNYVIDNLTINDKNKVDFLIVDEFQDLSVSMLLALQKCIRSQEKGGRILLLGDDAQNIFGKRIPWNRFNLGNISQHILRLDHVYRNTYEIYELAETILNHPLYSYSGSAEVENKPLKSKIHGASPQYVNCHSLDECANQIINFFEQHPNESNAVIFLNNKLYSDMKNNLINYKENIETIKRVKGLEFDNVVIPFINDINLDSQSNGNRDKKEVISEHLKSCYVAVTRAKKNLLLINHVKEEN